MAYFSKRVTLQRRNMTKPILITLIGGLLAFTAGIATATSWHNSFLATTSINAKNEITLPVPAITLEPEKPQILFAGHLRIAEDEVQLKSDRLNYDIHVRFPQLDGSEDLHIITTQTINYDLKSHKELKLADLFKANTDYLEFIALYCTGRFKLFREPLKPKAETFTSWNLTSSGIQITFDACAIAACADGAQEVTIPFSDLEPYLKRRWS